MSLDSLTPEERQEFERAKARATLLTDLIDDSDPETSMAAKRLLKHKKPELRFPEIETADAVAAATKEMQAKNDELRQEILRNRAEAALQTEDEEIRKAQLDPVEVRKFMQEHGTTNLGLAIEVLQSRQALAAPTPSGFEPVKIPDLKEMWEDPTQYRMNEGYKVQAELRGQNRPIVRQAVSPQQ